MKNLKLWMEAIAEELEKVHVSGREDIATMNKVFNTLKKLEEELEQIKAEMAQDSVQNDYQRLQELCALIEEKQGLLDSALERWLTLSEEMGNN